MVNGPEVVGQNAQYIITYDVQRVMYMRDCTAQQNVTLVMNTIMNNFLRQGMY